jgi:hypothetical protein
MVKYCMVFLFLYSGKLFSQADIDIEIPIRNQQIIDYVNSVKGKRVGKGICRNLCQTAVRKHGDKSKKLYRETGRYGVRIKDTTLVMPGDFIIFSAGCKFDYGNIITQTPKGHIGIVYTVFPDGVFEVAEQNVNTEGQNLMGIIPDSKVVLNLYDLNKKVKGRIKFYRVI